MYTLKLNQNDKPNAIRKTNKDKQQIDKTNFCINFIKIFFYESMKV